MAKLLRQIDLAADSPGQAWYRLRLLGLAEGYTVVKSSGRQGSRGSSEAWFRWSRAEAERCFEAILQRKTRSGRQRIYRFANSPQDQLSFF